MPIKSDKAIAKARDYYKSLLNHGKADQAESYRSSHQWAFKSGKYALPPKLGGEGVKGQAVGDSGTNPSPLAGRDLQRGFTSEGEVKVWEWKPESESVVWEGDPEGSVELEVVGVPRNVLMRLVRSKGGKDGVLMVSRREPGMMRWRVSGRVVGEGVWEMVGMYDRRSGDRYA